MTSRRGASSWRVRATVSAIDAFSTGMGSGLPEPFSR
jgi:hypothetical protein